MNDGIFQTTVDNGRPNIIPETSERPSHRPTSAGGWPISPLQYNERQLFGTPSAVESIIASSFNGRLKNGTLSNNEPIFAPQSSARQKFVTMLSNESVIAQPEPSARKRHGTLSAADEFTGRPSYKPPPTRKPIGSPQPNKNKSSVAHQTLQNSVKPKKYSTICDHSYRCRNGLRCPFTHSAKEIRFFEQEPDPLRRATYKLQPCTFYLTSKCRFDGTLSYLCRFSYGHL